MARVRTIDEAFRWLKEVDPETAMTKTALRRLVVSGEIPRFMVGCKYLLDLDALEDYLHGSVPAPATVQGIREVRL